MKTNECPLENRHARLHVASLTVAARPSRRSSHTGVPWTEEEHRLFLLGLQKLGKVGALEASSKLKMSRAKRQSLHDGFPTQTCMDSFASHVTRRGGA